MTRAVRHALTSSLATLVLLAGCHEQVLTARPEDEANTALATLARSGVQARKTDAGRGLFDISVPPSEFDAALEVLSVAGLPREPEPGLSELFPEPGLVSNPTEQRIRYHQALAAELGSSLRRLSGVREARVHLGLPAEQPRRLDRTPQKPLEASVMLIVESLDESRPESSSDAARRLVAGAVVGLEPEAVSVVMTSAPALPEVASAQQAKLQPAMLAAGLGTTVSGLVLAALLLIRRRAPVTGESSK